MSQRSTERIVQALASRVEVLAAAAESRELAQRWGLSADAAERLSLVVAELGGNAVRHAGGGVVAVTVGEDGWSVEVEDRGPGFPAPVLSDAGRSDRLGAAGVRPPGDGQRSFGSGLASVRRLASRLELKNRAVGALALAHFERSRTPNPERKVS